MQDTGLKRNTLDKYYTSNTTVNLCYLYIKKYVKIQPHDLIIEPSAGNGAFIPILKKLNVNMYCCDIEPEHSEIMKQNYLTLDTDIAVQLFNKIHVIGNPPFGRQSSMAIKFIKKSASFADSITFILPRSFKKQSLQKYYPLCFHLVFEIDIPEYSFIINNKPYNVPCVFQIWEKRAYNRELPEKLVPTHFTFVKKENNPDISFRRVGVYAGKIDIDVEKSEQSHYFIQFNDIISTEKKELIIGELKKIAFETNNTVGPKSISKQELIKEFNACIQQCI